MSVAACLHLMTANCSTWSGPVFSSPPGAVVLASAGCAREQQQRWQWAAEAFRLATAVQLCVSGSQQQEHCLQEQCRNRQAASPAGTADCLCAGFCTICMGIMAIYSILFHSMPYHIIHIGHFTQSAAGAAMHLHHDVCNVGLVGQSWGN